MMRAAILGAMLMLSGCAGMGAAGDPVFASAGSAAGIEVRAPDWQVGSEWHYSDGYGLKVTKATAGATTFQRTDDPAQWVVRRGFLREDAQSPTVLRKLMFEDLPPGAGTTLSGQHPITYRREYMAGNVQRTHVTSWTVEGRETVKVPAGQFECVVLAMRTRNTEDGWTGFERWWFSPQSQNFVRMEYRYGNNPVGSRVLTEYRVGPTPLGTLASAAPAVATVRTE